MEGSTRVKMDFDQKVPYLEVRVSKSSEDSRDELIHHFMAQGQYGQRRPWFTYVGKDEAKDLDYWRLDWIENPTVPVAELEELAKWLVENKMSSVLEIADIPKESLIKILHHFNYSASKYTG